MVGIEPFLYNRENIVAVDGKVPMSAAHNDTLLYRFICNNDNLK